MTPPWTISISCACVICACNAVARASEVCGVRGGVGVVVDEAVPPHPDKEMAKDNPNAITRNSFPKARGAVSCIRFERGWQRFCCEVDRMVFTCVASVYPNEVPNILVSMI